jgi:hypothetical protein
VTSSLAKGNLLARRGCAAIQIDWGCGLRSARETTEFYVCIASGVAVPIASMVVGTKEGHSDYFRADKPGSSS